MELTLWRGGLPPPFICFPLEVTVSLERLEYIHLGKRNTQQCFGFFVLFVLF
ncbi:rCG30050 [Rattus norvegicus]|uniref:RCG30050 n=1 Tax=Rattus norvegicus TaxID=10116 RepID=A6IM67_RAT|nr:rCG30050 [Rattus norvegicus]